MSIFNTIFPNLRKVGTITLAGATSGSLTGLSGTKTYFLVINLKNDNGGAGNTLSLYFNADTTANHYYSQYSYGANNVVGATRANNAVVWSLNASEGMMGHALVKIGSDSYLRSIITLTIGTTAQYVATSSITKTDATATGITAIAVAGSQNLTGTIVVYEVL